MEIVNIIILLSSGLLLIVVGISRLINPVSAYSKNSGIKLTKDVDLLNEMRGVSALMLLGGILIALGTIIPVFTFTSFIVASLIFLGFAIGRFFSIAKDGRPNKQLIQGISFELVLGAGNVFALLYSVI